MVYCHCWAWLEMKSNASFKASCLVLLCVWYFFPACLFSLGCCLEITALTVVSLLRFHEQVHGQERLFPIHACHTVLSVVCDTEHKPGLAVGCALSAWLHGSWALLRWWSGEHLQCSGHGWLATSLFGAILQYCVHHGSDSKRRLMSSFY